MDRFFASLPPEPILSHLTPEQRPADQWLFELDRDRRAMATHHGASIAARRLPVLPLYLYRHMQRDLRQRLQG